MTHDVFSPAWADWYCSLGQSQKQVNEGFLKAIVDTRTALCTVKGYLDNVNTTLSVKVGDLTARMDKAESAIIDNSKLIDKVTSDLKNSLIDIEQFKNIIIEDNQRINNLVNEMIAKYTSLYKQVQQNTLDIIEINKIIDPALLEQVIKTWKEAITYVDQEISAVKTIINTNLELNKQYTRDEVARENERAVKAENGLQTSFTELAGSVSRYNQASISRDNALQQSIDTGIDNTITQLGYEVDRATKEEAELYRFIQSVDNTLKTEGITRQSGDDELNSILKRSVMQIATDGLVGAVTGNGEPAMSLQQLEGRINTVQIETNTTLGEHEESIDTIYRELNDVTIDVDTKLREQDMQITAGVNTANEAIHATEILTPTVQVHKDKINEIIAEDNNSNAYIQSINRNLTWQEDKRNPITLTPIVGWSIYLDDPVGMHKIVGKLAENQKVFGTIMRFDTVPDNDIIMSNEGPISFVVNPSEENVEINFSGVFVVLNMYIVDTSNSPANKSIKITACNSNHYLVGGVQPSNIAYVERADYIQTPIQPIGTPVPL